MDLSSSMAADWKDSQSIVRFAPVAHSWRTPKPSRATPGPEGGPRPLALQCGPEPPSNEILPLSAKRGESLRTDRTCRRAGDDHSRAAGQCLRSAGGCRVASDRAAAAGVRAPARAGAPIQDHLRGTELPRARARAGQRTANRAADVP